MKIKIDATTFHYLELVTLGALQTKSLNQVSIDYFCNFSLVNQLQFGLHK